MSQAKNNFWIEGYRIQMRDMTQWSLPVVWGRKMTLPSLLTSRSHSELCNKTGEVMMSLDI